MKIIDRSGVLGVLALLALLAGLLAPPGGASRPGDLRLAASVTPDDYEFVTQFSAVQGQDRWHYLTWNGAQYAELTKFDTAGQYWSRPDCDWCRIGRGNLHPGTGYDAVIGWQAPRAGWVTLRGSMEVRQFPDGDGTETSIRKGGATVWPSSGTQVLTPGLMAEHVARVQVAAGEYLYFHVNKRGNTGYDATQWNPRVTYDYEPKYTLDKLEPVMEPKDFDRIGIDLAQDGSLAVLPNGSSFDFYLSGGVKGPEDGSAPVHTAKWRGSLGAPAQTPVYSRADFFSNGGRDTEKWWIENLYRAPNGHLLAFTHIERADVAAVGFWALGLAYSTDDGATFHRLGHIIHQYSKDPGEHTNISGVPYVVKDGYFYIYYNERNSATDNDLNVAAAARAPVADVLAAAQAGTVTPWKKYLDGAWTSDGLTGAASAVFNESGSLFGTHGDAAYSTYLGKYILSGDTGSMGHGVFLAFGDDPSRYEVPTWLQSSVATDWDTLSPYESIVNADGTDNGEVGQSFWVYFNYRPRWLTSPKSLWPQEWRSMYRVKVTLNRAGFDANARVASAEYTDKGGVNDWNGLYFDLRGGFKAGRYDVGRFGYTDDSQWLTVDSHVQHPDGGRDAVRQWVAVRPGTVTLTARDGIRVAGGPGADGVGVKIQQYHRSTNQVEQLWPPSGYATVPAGGVLDQPTLQKTVAAGDWLLYQVNQNTTSSFDTTLWDPVVTYSGPGGRLSWDAYADYGQTGTEWRYAQYTGGVRTAMHLIPAGQPNAGCYQGTAQYSLLCGTGAHPDGGADSVREWVAPRAGRVAIMNALDTISIANGPNADGVQVKVTLNGANVWPAQGYQAVPAGGALPFPAQVITVQAGQTIAFHVNQNGNNAYDSTSWDPVVAYR